MTKTVQNESCLPVNYACYLQQKSNVRIYGETIPNSQIGATKTRVLISPPNCIKNLSVAKNQLEGKWALCILQYNCYGYYDVAWFAERENDPQSLKLAVHLLKRVSYFCVFIRYSCFRNASNVSNCGTLEINSCSGSSVAIHGCSAPVIPWVRRNN